MYKIKLVIAALLVGLLVLVGSALSPIHNPSPAQPAAVVTPTPDLQHPQPDCGGNSCG